MKNTYLVWVFIVGVVITVLFAFNYRAGKKAVPLSEIFPDEETYPVDMDYEIVDKAAKVTEEKTILANEAAEKTTEHNEQLKTAVKTLTGADISDVPFAIQVSSFKDQKKAEQTIEKLLKEDYMAYLVSKNLGEKGTWHRVYVGKFHTKEKAEETLTKLKSQYKDSFIIAPAKVKSQ